MRIVSYRRDNGEVRFGIVDADSVLDAGTALASHAAGPAVGTLKEVAVLAPIPKPGKVIRVGRIYADHAAETGS